MLGREKELGTRVECLARIPISQNATKTVIVIGAAFVAAAHRRRGKRRTATASTLLEGSLRGGEAGNRNPEGATTDITEPEVVAEFDARRFSAVLAADSDLDVGPGLATEIAGDFH